MCTVYGFTEHLNKRKAYLLPFLGTGVIVNIVHPKSCPPRHYSLVNNVPLGQYSLVNIVPLGE